MKWLIFFVACAECDGGYADSLVSVKATDSETEAKALSWFVDQKWQPHPQGGVVDSRRSGEVWVISFEDFVKVDTEKTYEKSLDK